MVQRHPALRPRTRYFRGPARHADASRNIVWMARVSLSSICLIRVLHGTLQAKKKPLRLAHCVAAARSERNVTSEVERSPTVLRRAR